MTQVTHSTFEFILFIFVENKNNISLLFCLRADYYYTFHVITGDQHHFEPHFKDVYQLLSKMRVHVLVRYISAQHKES